MFDGIIALAQLLVLGYVALKIIWWMTQRHDDE